MAINTQVDRAEMPGNISSNNGDFKMPGTILSAVTRRRIADCHIKTAKFTSDRKGLIAIYEAARLSLRNGELFEEVCFALSKRADELGVNKKGAK